MNKNYIEINKNIERFKFVVSESNGIGEICRKFNLTNNGKSYNIIKEFIFKLGLDTSHFGLKNHPRKYNLLEKECPVCKNKFLTKLNHRDEKYTCSHSCANKHFRRFRSDEEKNKIRDGIKIFLEKNGRILIDSGKTPKTNGKIKLSYILENKLICKYCKSQFIGRIKQQYCSYDCRNKCTEYRKKIRDIQNERVKSGMHSGWRSRNMPSYAELFFMDVLRKNNIKYEFERNEGKYFIDFAIVDKKIALEIDGKQHLEEDRKKSDKLKDDFLKSNNWKVYRIPWKSINTVSGKEYIKSEISKFLEFYKINPFVD